MRSSIPAVPDPAAAPRREANLFDLIRLGAAALVIIGHAWSLTGSPGVPRLAGISIHHLGVYIFFAVSGFLIARSWERDGRAPAFLIRRALRIFPALFVVVVTTAFVLGPLLTNDRGGYWASGQTWGYLSNITLLATYELPGVFEANPKHAVNGSLWSLGPEFCCYVMVMLLGIAGVRFARVVRAGLAAVIAVIVLLMPVPGELRTMLIAVVFFLIGSLLAAVDPQRRLPIAPGLVGAVPLLLVDGAVGLVLAWLVLPYLLISAGLRRSGIARVLRRLGDPSYGMYLWGFPVQQILLDRISDVSVGVSVAVVLPIAVLLGYASWHAVEKHAIRLGARLSRRGGEPVVALA